MMEKGVIRESNSEFASPVVLAKKKNGEYRFCIDYRKLNDQTVIQPFPIFRMDELLDSIGTAKWFTSLDLESGYHQVRIEENSIDKTAFITKDSLFEWLRMPFGLVNAPYTFQKMMNHIFKEYLWKFAIIYLDDILIFSTSIEKHKEHVKAVFNKIISYGLGINLKKCSFGVEKVEFLGYSIANGSITMPES